MKDSAVKTNGRERIVSYVSPREKAFLNALSNATTQSQSAITQHALAQLKDRYTYIHSIPLLRDRLIAIIKSYGCYATQNGNDDGIRIGDTVFCQKIRFNNKNTLEEVCKWLNIEHDSFVNACESANKSVPRYMALIPTYIKDLQFYSVELNFESVGDNNDTDNVQ